MFDYTYNKNAPGNVTAAKGRYRLTTPVANLPAMKQNCDTNINNILYICQAFRQKNI